MPATYEEAFDANLEQREQLLEWQDGQTCKSDVKVLLHFRSAKHSFSSRETRFGGVDDVRVLLQRKKFWGTRQVQQKRGGVNVLQYNRLRSESTSGCCTRVAMWRQSVCQVLRFSRAPRRFFRPRRDTIATQKNFLFEHAC